MKTKNIFLSATIIALAFVACNNQTEENTTETAQDEAVVETPAPVEINGDVYFVNVKDSQDIKLPFIVQFGVNGMEVEPAGEIRAGKGHHHLLIDKSFDPEGTVVPASETSIHYGKGQTQDTIKTLSKGKHTLTLQFANGAHMSYGEKLSKTITVNVK
jgi:hypothetical protein